MPSDESITHWIHQLQSGDHDAAQHLFDRYFERLIALARSRLPAAARRASDEEDVAVNALHSFFQGVRQQQFPQLNDRTSLWPLLARITACKAINQQKREASQKRGGGHVRGDSGFWTSADADESRRMIEVIGNEPTPAFATEMSEQCRNLMALLDDDSLRNIARLKLEGHSNAEIANHLGVVERTIERKLNRIRAIWMEHAQPDRTDD